MGCPGRCSHRPWRCLRPGWRWHSVSWSGWHSSARSDFLISEVFSNLKDSVKIYPKLCLAPLLSSWWGAVTSQDMVPPKHLWNWGHRWGKSHGICHFLHQLIFNVFRFVTFTAHILLWGSIRLGGGGMWDAFPAFCLVFFFAFSSTGMGKLGQWVSTFWFPSAVLHICICIWCGKVNI